MVGTDNLAFKPPFALSAQRWTMTPFYLLPARPNPNSSTHNSQRLITWPQEIPNHPRSRCALKLTYHHPHRPLDRPYLWDPATASFHLVSPFLSGPHHLPTARFPLEVLPGALCPPVHAVTTLVFLVLCCTCVMKTEVPSETLTSINCWVLP